MSSPSSDSSRSSSPSVEHFDMHHPRPDMTSLIAAECVGRMVANELQHAGFDSAADRDTFDQVHGIAIVFFESLVQRAHELAEHGRRTALNLKDAVEAATETGAVNGVPDLLEELAKTKDRAETPLEIRYKRARQSIVEKTLPSDDEEDLEDDTDDDKQDPTAHLQQSIIPKVKPRKLPDALSASYLPPLPPKHTFKQTPVYPQPSAPPLIPAPTYQPKQQPSAAALRHLATLRARFNDSQLVSSSLRNLIRKTSARTAAVTSVDDDAANRAAGLEEEWTDIVDYEGEWYGSATSGKTLANRKKDVEQPGESSGGLIVLRVAKDGTIEKDDVAGNVGGAGDDMSGKKKLGQVEWTDAGRVGVASKRRKWRA